MERREIVVVWMTSSADVVSRRQFRNRSSVLGLMLLITTVGFVATNAPNHGMPTTASAADKQNEVTP